MNTHTHFQCSPKSDTCKTCDTLKVKCDAETDSAAKSQLVAEWELHKRRAERAYQELKEDSAKAKTNTNLDVLCFDLQQALPTPLISTSIVFYKRQMWCYNLGIHDCGSNKGYMCMWNESLASRGSQEIASCLLKFMRSKSSSAKRLTCYSDSCGGQNRNINVSCMWLHVVASDNFSYETVDHKFMVSGHSYLPNDRDFACIENAKRRTQVIYLPSHWCDLVRDCRRQNPFEVIDMTLDDFQSVEPVKSCIVNRKKTDDKEKVEWMKMKWVRYEKSTPFSIKFRYSHNELEQWKVLNVKRRGKGRPPDLGRIDLPRLRDRPRGIPPKKLEDLLSLLDFIPPAHHSFYTSLAAETEEEAQSECESESEE